MAMHADNINAPVSLAARQLAFAITSTPHDKFDYVDRLQESITRLAYAVVDEVVERVNSNGS